MFFFVGTMAVSLEEYKRRLNGDSYYYGNASHAIHDVLTWLQEYDARKNPNVVLPVYIPAKMYRMVFSAGYLPKFYQVYGSCQIDLSEIESLIDEQTKAVIGIHYFGRPAPAKALRALTKKKKVFFIEDCAHVLLSKMDGMELGSFGDCAVFSMRKMLMTPAGGLLVMRNHSPHFRPTYRKSVNSLYTLNGLTKTRVKHSLLKLTKGWDPFGLSHIPKVGLFNPNERQHFTIKKASGLNIWYSNYIDLEEVAFKRRENFRYLQKLLSDLAIVKPMSLEGYNEITPYSFPVLIPRDLRDVLQKELLMNGISCGKGWPESPFGFKSFAATADLSQRILELPIHQGINKYQLRRIADVLYEYEAETLKNVWPRYSSKQYALK